MSNAIQFCRICFRNNNLLRKLHELDIDGVKLSDKLKSCVPEILYSTELEKYEMICIDCCQFLKTAYMFKELCIRSNILLQGCLNRNELPFSNNIIDKLENNSSYQTYSSGSTEEYTTLLPEQFVSTCLSDSDEDTSLDLDGSKKSSLQDSNDSSDLPLHLRNLIELEKTTDKPTKKPKPTFACFHCERKFTKKTYLRKHMFIHSGERPFICFLCNMTFNRKNTLETHMLIHSGIKKYKCNVCGKCFRLKCALDRHLLIHSDYKAFKCKICGKAFGRKDHLEKHGKVHRHLYDELKKIQ